jgi:xanthine dehydrogenase accessory factor
MSRWPDWPLYGLENDLLPAAEACLARTEPFALATLIRIEGSSPRPLGAEMLVSASGEAHGYVSGGCVEAAVAREALACLQDGKPRLLDYGQGSETIDIQLSCGGRIHILVRAVTDPEWWVSRLREVRFGRRPLHVRTELATGCMYAVEDPVAIEGSFVKRYTPAVRLVLVGADPVTMATAMLADAVGMEVVLWRPNGPAAPPAELPLHGYLASAVSEGLRALPLDADAALYCLSHDMAQDVDILRHALASDAFCVGVLGSRSKRALRQQALREAGATDAQLTRLRSPAGISISASSPQEIALSILAEVVACRASADKEAESIPHERERHALAC